MSCRLRGVSICDSACADLGALAPRSVIPHAHIGGGTAGLPWLIFAQRSETLSQAIENLARAVDRA